LSFPKNSQSVNSTIPYENSTVTLETFDDVANLVLSAGKNCLIAKADIEEAFKIIPISPLDYHKLGFSFNNCFYFQTVLPMGASSSVQIFKSFSKALQWILQNKFQVRRVSHIVDDFIFVGPANTNTCQAALDTFLNLASDLGVPIKNDKTIQPSTCVEVHGILLGIQSKRTSHQNVPPMRSQNVLLLRVKTYYRRSQNVLSTKSKRTPIVNQSRTADR